MSWELEIQVVLLSGLEGDRDVGIVPVPVAMSPGWVGRDLSRMQRWLWENLLSFKTKENNFTILISGKNRGVSICSSFSSFFLGKCGSLWDETVHPKSFPSRQEAGIHPGGIHYLCPAEPLLLLLTFSRKKNKPKPTTS